MTVDLNEKYGVTISEEDRDGKDYVASGSIFHRKTMQDVGKIVYGRGRTWSAASRRALEAAEQAVVFMRD